MIDPTILAKIEEAIRNDATELDLSFSQLTYLPPEVGQLSNLRALHLSNNQLISLPPEIGELTNLEVLNLPENQLTSLPPEIGELTNLEVLHLHENQLTSLPPEIDKLSNLRELSLSEYQLTSLPPEIGQLCKLESLYLGNSQLTRLPPEIGQLSALSTLYLRNSNLVDLPSEIGQLSNLTIFHLFGNQLTNLPSEIGQLSNLQMLHLSNNQLVRLPLEIGQLSALSTLYLSSNRLDSLPSEIGQLSNLTALHLNGNRLTNLPSEIGQLQRLKRLNLSKNQLTSLPSDIGQLHNLKVLNLNENQLKSLPSEISQLQSLEDLDLRDNPLPIPPEILAKTNEPATIISYYLYDQTSIKHRPLNEAKMLLVGQGYVGKTSLVKRLLDNYFDPHESETEGINIRQWGVMANGQEIRLNIWDFGGQEIMHATHQFFLTKRSLYVLVLISRQDEYDNRIEYWLKLIKSFGGESPIIIVVNKCDEEKISNVDQRGLNAKYPTIKGFVYTSCKTGQGISKLSELISQEISQLDHIHDELPGSWFAIKEILEGLDKDYIAYHEYETLCEEQGVKDAQRQHTLISLLHDLGVVLSFHDDLRLQDTNILNPEWVTNGVYRILNHPSLFQAHGVLDRTMLADILDCPEYRDKHMFIVDMMRKFELCFYIDTDIGNERFLVPELLPKEEPDTGEWPDDKSLSFQYHYNVLPGSVISRFIVRSHMLVYKNTYWRNGVMLTWRSAQALIKADAEERKIYIYVTGPVDGIRRELLAVIRAVFDHIHRTISRLEAEEMVPVPGHPDIQPVAYDYLLTLEEMGVTKFVPPGLREWANVKKLLQGVGSTKLMDDPVKTTLKRRLQKLKEQQAIQGISTPPEVLIEIENISNELDQLQ